MNGKIYVLGGFGSSDWDEVLVLDPATGQWVSKSPLPITGRRGILPQYGMVRSMLQVGNSSGDLNSTLQLMIPILDVWKILPELNKSRNWPSLFVVGGRLYIVGGTQNSETNFLSSIEVYDADANEWIMAGDLPEAKYCAGSAVVNGKVYLFAGRNETAMNNKMFVGEPNSVVLVQNRIAQFGHSCQPDLPAKIFR